MSAKVKSLAHTGLSPYLVTSHEPARCAISEAGKIIYANAAFHDLVDLDDLDGIMVSDIFTFSEDGLDTPEDIRVLPSGYHAVHIRGNPIVSEFQFDWLNAPDERRYLIASIAQGSAENILDFLAQDRPELKFPVTRSIDHDFLEFVNLTHDVMVMSDLNGQILKANNSFSAVFLQEGEDAAGLSFFDMFGEEDQLHIRSTMQALIREAKDQATDRTINFESRMVNRKGDVRWIEWRQKYARDAVFSSGRDITDIKQKHEALLRRQRQLSEAEAIGRMGHWHWLIGEDQISWSEEIFRIFGLDENHFVPTINKMTELIHKRDLGRVVQVFQGAMIQGQNYDMEFRILRPGGSVRFIHCEGRCEKDEHGEVIALYGIMQDMTERMLYEQELKEAKNASEQAYIAKSRFLANMSHELRTPLNAIIGFSEMIAHQMLGSIQNDKYVDYANSIRESGAHLLDLISDILDMSKIEAGKYTLDLEELLVGKVIQRAVHMVESRARERNIALDIDHVIHDDLILYADRRALTQVFLNLLSNAVKFTKPGGRVWIESQKSDTFVTFRICDNGIGIPPNKLANVLHPFEQVSSEYTREYEGTGLGLSITKELVELHGGSVSIESQIGTGTKVSIRLPCSLQ